jgi:hypothetical protein
MSFLWGKVRDPSAGSLLSVCYAGLLTVFQFCSIVWLYMLLTSSGDELCGPLSALFQAVAYHLPTVSPLSFQSLYCKFTQRSATCSSPFSSVLRAPCMFLFSSLFIIQFFFFFFFFFCWVGVSLSRELCWSISGVGVGIPRAAYLLTCWSASPKQVWSQCLAAREPSCFLSVTWHREALYRLEVQCIRVLILLGVFFLPSVALVSQQNFWFTELTLSASAF